MSSALLKCVPNLSEGRNHAALDSLWAQLNEIAQLQCLHRSSDVDHHRTVLTLAGPPESIRAAGHCLFAWAQRHIDLRQHQGVHPRVGAVDVFPLVPLQGLSQSEAVSLAQEFAQEYAERWQLPLYLYEAAAATPERAPLPAVRRGGLEGLRARMHHPDWQPDYGPNSPHPQLGATVLGVRKILIAWNVLLNSKDLALAQDIARHIRARNGGFKHLRALGLYLASRDCVQVSMNLLDDLETSPLEVFQSIQAQAAQAGVEVLETEFIGLPPARIFLEAGLRVFSVSQNFSAAQLLDARLVQGAEILRLFPSE